MNSKPKLCPLCLLASAMLIASCSSVQASRTSVFVNEGEFYSSIKPANLPVVSSIRAIEKRPENAKLVKRMQESQIACDAWMAVREEKLQPWEYSYTSACFLKDRTVRVATFTASGEGEVVGRIVRDETGLLLALERPTIVADSGLGISDCSFTFITLFAKGKVYRHAIVCDELVERSDQNESFALIASSLKMVRELVAEAQHR